MALVDIHNPFSWLVHGVSGVVDGMVRASEAGWSMTAEDLRIAEACLKLLEQLLEKECNKTTKEGNQEPSK